MTNGSNGELRVSVVAVIGAGPAGRAFALRCAEAGFEVVLEDVMPSKLRRAQDEYREVPGGIIRYATTVEDAVRDADLTIDFVPDELESKLEIFSMVDRMAPPRTILCTPTNALSITDLASCTYRPERCVGIRGDVSARDVELSQSRFLSAQVEHGLVEFFTRCGVTARFVADREEPMLVKNARQ